MKYPLLPVPLYAGELEPGDPLETRTCASCAAIFRTRRRGLFCFTCAPRQKLERPR